MDLRFTEERLLIETLQDLPMVFAAANGEFRDGRKLQLRAARGRRSVQRRIPAGKIERWERHIGILQ
jgi:hypothetical protein